MQGSWVSELEAFSFRSLGIPIFGAKSRCCPGSMKFKDSRIMDCWKTGKNMSPVSFLQTLRYKPGSLVVLVGIHTEIL